MTITNASACTRRTTASSGSTSTGAPTSTEVRRSRRLVVSFIATVGNYEYGFYWYFYQDGTHPVRGQADRRHLQRRAAAGRDSRRGATLVAPQLYAPNHQHFFNVRLDMTVDGRTTRSTRSTPWPTRAGPGEPVRQRVPRRGDAAGDASRRRSGSSNPLSARFWKIVNPASSNRLGQPVAYKLVPGENVLPFAGPRRSVLKRAGVHDQAPVGDAATTRRAVRRRRLPEPASGRRRPAGVRRSDDRRSTNTDVVVWYTFGAHHVVAAGGLAGDAGVATSASRSSRSASSTATPAWTCRPRRWRTTACATTTKQRA